jgi:hypothetical protein
MATRNYVIVEASNYNGMPCSVAQIIKSYTTRKSAENNCPKGAYVMTRRQAESFIKSWNTDYFSSK